MDVDMTDLLRNFKFLNKSINLFYQCRSITLYFFLDDVSEIHSSQA